VIAANPAKPSQRRASVAGRGRLDRTCRVRPDAEMRDGMSLTYVIRISMAAMIWLGRALTKIAAYWRKPDSLSRSRLCRQGPDSRQSLTGCLSGVADGWRLIALKGNHDAIWTGAS